MMLSVALCTYNGERFLAEQLESISAQSRRPDELVICDDRSTDGTPELLRTFAARALFPVRWQVNPVNLGSSANFGLAISRCRGDVIALSDQDDVWEPDKLALLEGALAESPRAGLVCSDATLVDTDLRPLGLSLWEAIQLTPGDRGQFAGQDPFALLLRRYCVTGATVAFRASFRDLVLPIPAGWVHDGWIALLIAALAQCRLVEKPLVRYRQHAGQQIGARKRGLFEQYRVARKLTRADFQATADRFAEALRRLHGWPGVRPGHLRRLQEKVQHYERRVRMRDAGVWRLPLVAGELLRGRYARYSQGWKALALDLLVG